MNNNKVNQHPQVHRNDLADTAIGFGVSFGFFFLLGVVATIVSLPPVKAFFKGLF